MTSVLSYAFNSTVRNKRRSFTLMLGIIISLAVISGVLFYVDNASGTLVETALREVDTDLIVSAEKSDFELISQVNNFAETNLSDMVISSELLLNINPFVIRTPGAVASTELLPETLTRSSDINFTLTYIMGVNSSFFSNTGIFNTQLSENEIDNILNSSVIVSNELITSLNLDIGDSFNLSLIQSQMIQSDSGRTIKLIPNYTSNFSIGSTVSVNQEVFMNLLTAFYSEEDTNSFTTQYANTPNIVLMSYNRLYNIIYNNTSFISSNSIIIKIDHSQLSDDLDVLASQIAGLSSKIEVYYPDTEIYNFLNTALEQVNTQLTQMKLFLIYFSLPGILLGILISKYAIDLNIEERRREIGLLRTKAARRKQIAMAIALENSIISLIGLIIGIFGGYGLSYAIVSKYNPMKNLDMISLSSILFSIGFGIIFAVILSFLSTRSLLSPNIISSIKIQDSKNTLWKKIYLDIILLLIAGTIYLLNYLHISLLSDTMLTISNIFVPILSWIAISLLLTRIFRKIIVEGFIFLTQIYRFIFKEIARIITKNILFRPSKLSTIAILLTLATSFGLTLAIVSNSYQVAAISDATYNVGADLRIQFPGPDYLNYNTTDFIDQLTNTFPEIKMSTEVYVSNLKFGKTSISLLGIDTETFFDVVYLQDYFLQSGSINQAKISLNTLFNNSFSNVIISSALANPTEIITTGGGKGSGGASSTEGITFNTGDIVPFSYSGNAYNVKIADIANYFPAVSDITGRPEGAVPFAVANLQYLISPSENNSLLSNNNASLSFIKVNNGVDSQDLSNRILSWYTNNFEGSDKIIIKNLNDEIENYQILSNSLLGLTSIEYILILMISSLGVQIFLTSSILERAKEFGTYFAIGASIKDIRKILFGEISTVIIFSLIIGVGLSLIISILYLPFLSTLLILQIQQIYVPINQFILLLVLELLGGILAITISSKKLASLDPANILRAM